MDQMIDKAGVKKRRTEHSWSQEQLAAVAGLSPRTVQRVEAEGSCSLETKKALAVAFGVHASELDAAAETERFWLAPGDRRNKIGFAAGVALLVGAVALMTSCGSLIEFEGSSYKYVTETVSWTEAKRRAEDGGGQLATFSSREELAYVKSQLPNEHVFWVGLTDSAEEGVWRWVDGAPLVGDMRGSLDLGPDHERRDYAHITTQGVLGARNDSGGLPRGFRGKPQVGGYIVEFE